jgi:hypothetical protein
VNQDAISRSNASKKRKIEPGEIAPLFDCLFCCQEHFVLAKLSENTLEAKYSHKGSIFKVQKNLLMLNLFHQNKNPFRDALN